MARRALFSPVLWKQNLLLSMAMGSAAIMLGCGGGGGGTGGPGGVGTCGSAGGAGTVVCGFVIQVGSTTGVNNATVRLRNASGQSVTSVVTATDSVSGQAGFYKITVQQGATLISVDPPATGFLRDYIRYVNNTYDQQRTANAGGPCIPSLSINNPGGDNRLADLGIFSDQAAPPPPVFNCPR